MKTLRRGMLIRESDKAGLYEILLSTENSGVQILETWIPKSQCSMDEDGKLCVRTWVLDDKTAAIEKEHPDWGKVEILLAENPNQTFIPGCEVTES